VKTLWIISKSEIMGRFEFKWDHDATGYPCFIIIHDRGFRCGYVGVPKGHFLHGVEYSEKKLSPESRFQVHGGLTYSGNGFGYGDFWFFGFDCAHFGDAKDVRLMDMRSRELYKRYGAGPHEESGVVRSKEYVTKECDDLAQQLFYAQVTYLSLS